MENLDSVMRRISKLLAIAQDDRANPAEAASAAAMAEKIMRKFQIDNASVIAQAMKNNQGEEFGVGFVYGSTKPTIKSKTIQVWANWLALRIGQYNDCKVEVAKNCDEKRLIFKGYKPDVDVSKYMFCYIVGIMEQSAQGLEFDCHGREFMSSYRQGFVLAVCKKLEEMAREKQEQMQIESSSRALVVVKKQLVEQRFGAQEYGRPAVTKRRADAFMQGKEKGSRVDIGRRGIGQNASAGLLN